jgi:rifampicin phosphotransferase
MSTPQTNQRASPLVASLSAFERDDLMLAGGKGANLGELVHRGFAVPPGFVITTAAYDLLLQTNAVQDRLNNILASLDVEKPDSVAEISRQIHDLFQQIPIPAQITDEILRAYQELNDGAVAVRSSATAEDLPQAAFAGQQETFLNVIGEQQLMDAVRGCWASLWSERAILYRARQNIDQSTVKLAVVVQTMIPAEAAGVMFTANPVSGEREELIIDANPGLGEAVVGGMVTPDHFVINKRSRRIQEQRPGRREVVIHAKTGGGVEQIHSTKEITNTSALPLPAVSKLAGAGIEIERHYGAPQDIEWAWMQDDSKIGKFYILQSRPMTALPEPLNVSGPMRLVVPMLAEMWPTRPYPLDMTTFTGMIERAIGILLFTMIGKSAPNPDESFLEEDGVVVQFKPPQVRPSPSMLFTPWITMWRTRHYDLSRWESDPLLAEYLAKVRLIEQRDLGSLTWQRTIETIKESLALVPHVMELRERYLPRAIPSLAGLWLLLSLARRTDRFGTVVSGVKTKTTETNQALEELARQIRADKALHDLFARHDTQQLRSALQASKEGKIFLKQFETFLDQYGHRETSLTISQPAWKDQPEDVFAILKVLAETEPPKPDSYDAWRRTRDELLAGSILGKRLFRNLFLKSLTNARYFFQIREDTHFYATMVQPSIRRAALALGKRLVEADALGDIEEVFHLRLDELEAVGQIWPPKEQEITKIRSLVAQRKRKRQSLANKPMIDPRLLAISSTRGEGVLLSGTSGSPGMAQGPAKIVHNFSEFGKLRSGDVLVAPVTNPAWTPLFQRAVAVVVDTGGTASHAAIVAREYGIPAVMGTITGTKELADGQWIQVDGSRGLVLKAEKPK